MSVHPAAEVGFGRAADIYERSRPDYPREAVRWLQQRLGTGLTIDVGAGTGKFTQVLEGRVVAVEPVAAMRRTFAATVRGVPMVGATVERLPLPDASADAVVAAQAFHWFDGPRALAEIARVLRPGGRVGLVWNVRDGRGPWGGALTELLDRHAGATPRYRTMEWRRAFDASAEFTPLESATFPHEQRGTLGAILERVASISFVASMEPAARAGLLAEVRRLMESSESAKGRTEWVLPYRTDVYACVRRG